eukprot:70732-Chlamydomonas_euryale.AAC.1
MLLKGFTVRHAAQRLHSASCCSKASRCVMLLKSERLAIMLRLLSRSPPERASSQASTPPQSCASFLAPSFMAPAFFSPA